MVREVQRVTKQALILQLGLDDLHFADQVDVARPAWHPFVDLFVLVNNFQLLFEELLVLRSIHVLHVAPVVELFVVHKNICL